MLCIRLDTPSQEFLALGVHALCAKGFRLFIVLLIYYNCWGSYNSITIIIFSESSIAVIQYWGKADDWRRIANGFDDHVVKWMDEEDEKSLEESVQEWNSEQDQPLLIECKQIYSYSYPSV